LRLGGKEMRVDFFRGTVRDADGGLRAAHWAVFPLGGTALLPDARLVPLGCLTGVVSEAHVTGFDLPGVDREGLDAIVAGILTGGYLDKPGIAGKGEAVLFVLVNEALHELEEVALAEAKDDLAENTGTD
jgi:hypothetical protein